MGLGALFVILVGFHHGLCFLPALPINASLSDAPSLVLGPAELLELWGDEMGAEPLLMLRGAGTTLTAATALETTGVGAAQCASTRWSLRRAMECRRPVYKVESVDALGGGRYRGMGSGCRTGLAEPSSSSLLLSLRLAHRSLCPASNWSHVGTCFGQSGKQKLQSTRLLALLSLNDDCDDGGGCSVGYKLRGLVPIKEAAALAQTHASHVALAGSPRGARVQDGGSAGGQRLPTLWVVSEAMTLSSLSYYVDAECLVNASLGELQTSFPLMWKPARNVSGAYIACVVTFFGKQHAIVSLSVIPHTLFLVTLPGRQRTQSLWFPWAITSGIPTKPRSTQMLGSFCCTSDMLFLSNAGTDIFLGVVQLRHNQYTHLHRFYAVRSRSPFDILAWSSAFCLEVSGRFAFVDKSREASMAKCERIQSVVGVSIIGDIVHLSYEINNGETGLIRLQTEVVLACLRIVVGAESTQPFVDTSGASLFRMFDVSKAPTSLRPGLLPGKEYTVETLRCLRRAAAMRLVPIHIDKYPLDAPDHYVEVLKATAPFRDLPMFEYRGYRGPWLENSFISRFCCEAPDSQAAMWRFGEFIPLFVQWTDLRLLAQQKRRRTDGTYEKALKDAADRYELLGAVLKRVLRPNVAYLAVSQHDGGLPAGLLPDNALPNVMVLSAGGFGHVALPNLLRELYPSSKFAPLTLLRRDTRAFEIWFAGTLHPFRFAWVVAINEELRAQGLDAVRTVRERPSSESWRDHLRGASLCLAPRGMGRSSFMTYEAIQLGCVPVHIYAAGDDHWLPYHESWWHPIVERDIQPASLFGAAIGFAMEANRASFAAFARLVARLKLVAGGRDDPLLAMREKLRSVRDRHFTYPGVLVEIERFMLATMPPAPGYERVETDLKCHTRPPSVVSIQGPHSADEDLDTSRHRHR